ncbi:MAG: Wzz/FepE/Etk N-terminal domain-containing protein [Actinomycetota bacterium]|nr:Wzz/FepE/Etk N-terminal domain-containing protein [Actinomycetota bacterium]
MFPNLYRSLWRHRLLIATGTLTCLLFALSFSLTQPKRYEATAIVRLELSDAQAGARERFEAAQDLTRSYAEIYQRGGLSARLQTLLGTQISPRQIENNELVARTVKDLDLLAVGARTTDPRRSLLIANAAARVIGTFRAGERAVLIAPAELPTAPASPNIPFNLVLATLLGLIISSALALAVDAFRQPLPDADELERELELPVLGSIPRLKLGRSGGAQRDAAPESDGSLREPAGARAAAERVEAGSR